MEKWTPNPVSTKGLKTNTVYVLDMNLILNGRSELNPDIWRLVSSLQGVFNRDFKKHKIAIYINFEDNINEDMFWLDYMSGQGKMLAGYQRVTIKSLEVFLATFLNQLKDCGMILWDTAVPATANVAATACGIYNWLPVKYDTASSSLYTLLTKNGVKAKENLVGKFTGKGKIPDINIASTGSAKNDAYYWAAYKYMSKTDPEYIAYYVDGATTIPGNKCYIQDALQGGHMSSIPNHDFYISKRAFFFDLSPISTEKPCDDPNQKLGTDVDTYKKILATQCQRNNFQIIQGGGHVPWQLKYSNYNGLGSLSNLDVELKWANLASAHNVVSDSDAAHPCWLTNASIYAQYPIRSSYPNNTKSNENIKYDPNTVYLILYVGDYDGSSWLKAAAYDLWEARKKDNTRPMAWNFDPNLVNRVAPMFDYFYENMGKHDYFITCNNGAGNLQPGNLFKSLDSSRTLPDSGDAWKTFNQKFFKLFNISVTGMVYMGQLEKPILDLYTSFSPDGAFHCIEGVNNIAVKYKDMLWLYCDPHAVSTASLSLNDKVSRLTSSLTKNVVNGYHYGAFRTVGYSYQQIIELQDAVIAEMKKKDPTHTYVWSDPYTLFDAMERNGKYGREIK